MQPAARLAWSSAAWRRSRKIAARVEAQCGSLPCFRIFALRCASCASSPGFAITAILTLSLGIGASAAIFNVIDAVLLKPLPYANQELLVDPVMTGRTGDTLRSSYLGYLDVRAQQRTFDALAGYSVFGRVNLEGPSGPVALRAVKSTDNFFDVFGVKPMLGRTYLPGEDQTGKDNVVVLSYEVWQSSFAGSDRCSRQGR